MPTLSDSRIIGIRTPEVVQEYLDAGWIEYDRDEVMVWLGNPEKMCLHKMPRGGVCQLDKDHKSKRHSTVVFCCEGCSKHYRGQPFRYEYHYVHGELDEKFGFCIVCVKATERQHY